MSLDVDPETQRKNVAWGWAMFAFFCVLFAGTAAVAFIYLAVEG